MTRKRKLDRIREAVLEVYAERKAEGALPVTVRSVMWDLHQRGIENKNPATFEKAVTRVLSDEVPGPDIAWETPEERKARRPDPITKMILCQACGDDVAVPLDFKHPLGTSYDFYCKRPKCVAHRAKSEKYRAEQRAKYPHGVPVSTIEPLDPLNQLAKQLESEWGVKEIIASRGKPKILPPIKAVIVESARIYCKMTVRQVSALLKIKGFADVFLADWVTFYLDYASGNYSKDELEQRVKDKKYPSVHFDTNSSATPFWDKVTQLENDIIVRGLETRRHWFSQTLDNYQIASSEGEPVKRNGVPLGAGSWPGQQDDPRQGRKEQDFGLTETEERRLTEIEDDLRHQGIIGRKARMAFFRK